MRKTSKIVIILTLTFLLCSCVKNSETNTYFVHSAGFETDGKNVRLTAILEEHGKEKDGYFTASFTAPSITDAAKKLMSSYKDCYFATCDLYFLPIGIERDTLTSIAKEICDSNIYPTTGRIICVNDNKLQNFLKEIKDADRIKQLKADAKNNINTVSFFAKLSSKTSVSPDAYELNGKIPVRIGKATFSDGRKAVLHEKS